MSDVPLTPQPPEPTDPSAASGRDPMQRSIVIVAAVALVVLVIVLIAVLATRGGDDGVPTVRIVSLDASDRLAQVVFIADDDSGRALDVTVDWGDRSPLDQQRGSGELRALHQYGDEIDSAIVVIEVTDADGRSTRTARTLTLAPPTTTPAPTSTTSTTAGATTSSTASTTTTSTSTTEAPATTTSTTSTTSTSTTSTSTTTTSTTSTTTTTTTLPPDAIERVFQLSLDDARIDEFTQGENSEASVVSGDSIELLARTAGGDDDAHAAVSAYWTIPYSEFDQIGPAPSVSVYIESVTDLTMQTGPNPGRGALFVFDINGVVGGELIGSGSGTARSIESGAEFDDVVDDTAGFGTELDADSTDALVIELTVECSAFGGTTILQIAEDSRCAADFRVTELRVRITRN